MFSGWRHLMRRRFRRRPSFKNTRLSVFLWESINSCYSPFVNIKEFKTAERFKIIQNANSVTYLCPKVGTKHFEEVNELFNFKFEKKSLSRPSAHIKRGPKNIP